MTSIGSDANNYRRFQAGRIKRNGQATLDAAPSEGQLIVIPVTLKSGRFFWTNDNDFDIFLQKFLVILAQLRHMPAAVGSKKASIEQ